MMLDKSSETNVAIMRAYGLIQQTSGVVFVGIYSLETLEPLALADRDKVCVNLTQATEEDPAADFDVSLQPDELRAISTHIQSHGNLLAMIDIFGLRFVCFRSQNKCMTGMSNFNTDISVNDANTILYKIAQKRCSHTDLAEGFHPLQLSAIIKEGKLVIGISKSEKDSSLKTLKQMFETHDLQLRPSTKVEKERRRDKVRRETSFCEDWRTATVRSIEALKMIGPFQDDGISDDDVSPLMTNIQATATSPLPDFSKEWPESFEMDEDKDGGNSKGVTRRPSRATMV